MNVPQKLKDQYLEDQYIESINSNFVGRKIEKIFYEEINYEIDSEFWEHSQNIHSVDMNVIFQLDNGKLLQIKWDNEFRCYGIGFEELLEIRFREGFKTIDVTANQNWLNKINREISSVEVYWEKIESQEYHSFLTIYIPKGRKKITRLPMTWKINIQEKSVWISAFEISESENNYYTDHLTVLFKKEDVEKYSLMNAREI